MFYQWMAWLHVLFGVLFFFSHGVSMATAFLLPREKNEERIRMLMDVTGISIAPLGISLLGLLITSIYMGSAAGWWRTGWWGFSFLIFLAMVVWMTWYGRKYYSPIRRALGQDYMTGIGKHNPAEPPLGMDEVQRLVAKTNPHLLATVGFLVTAALLWLMRFKPF